MVLETQEPTTLSTPPRRPSTAGESLEPPDGEPPGSPTDAALHSHDARMETLLSWAREFIGTEEISRASDEFSRNMGKCFYDDRFYEARTTYFLDFFVFERPVSKVFLEHARDHGITKAATPFQLFLAGHHGLEEESLGPIRSLGRWRHSVFEVLKARPDALTVKDLLDGERFSIVPKGDELFHGIWKKDLLQGFLFPREETSAVLSSGLIPHPQGARRLIKKFIRKALKRDGTDRLTVLMRLSRQQIRYERHKHVDPRYIYKTPPRG